jgi:hypothetical protein
MRSKERDVWLGTFIERMPLWAVLVVSFVLACLFGILVGLLASYLT